MEIQKALDELKALKIDYNLDLGIDFEKAQLELNKAMQFQQTGVKQSVCDCESSEDIYSVDIYKCGKCHLKVPI